MRIHRAARNAKRAHAFTCIGSMPHGGRESLETSSEQSVAAANGNDRLQEEAEMRYLQQRPPTFSSIVFCCWFCSKPIL